MNDLAEGVARLDVEEEPLSPTRSLLGFRHQPPSRLKPAILVTIDQLEEIFQHPRGVRDAFGRGIQALLERPEVQILASLRSDFMPLMQEYTELHGLWAGIPIDKFDMRNLREIIVSPARRAGFAVDEQLIAALDGDADTSDALPLVAFALADIWRRAHARDDRTLSLADYRRSGEVAAERRLERILIERADAALRAIDPEGEHSDDLREAFIPHLVDVRDDGEPIRRRAPHAAIPAGATKLLEHLAGWEWRLITIDTDERGSRVFEVAHEALLRRWPMLRQAIEEESGNLSLLRAIEREADEWQRAGAARKDLLRLSGQRLEDATALVATDLYRGRIEAVRTYIRACEGEEHAKVAFVQRVRLDREQAIDWRLHKEIGSLADDGNAIEAVRLGRQVLKRASGRSLPHTEAQVARSLAAARLTRSLRDGSAGLCAVAISRDGRHIATGSSDGKLRLFDFATARMRWRQNCGGGWVHSVDFTPDGKRVLVGTAKGRVALYDVETEQEIATYMHATEVYQVCVDPTGRFVATAARNGEAHLLSTEDLRLSQIAVPPNHCDRVIACTFSPDGRRLATASWDHRVRLLDPYDPQSATFLAAHGHLVRGLAFSVSGARLLSWSVDGTAAIYSSAGELIDRIDNGFERVPISAGAFSSGERMVALVGADGTMGVFAIEGRKAVASCKVSGGAYTSVRFALSDTAVLLTVNDGRVELHALDSLKLGRLDPDWSLDLKTPVIGMREVPDEEQVAVFDASGGVNVLDVGRRLVVEGRVSTVDRLPHQTAPESLLGFAEKALIRDGSANPLGWVSRGQAKHESNSIGGGSYLIWPMVKLLGADCHAEAHDGEFHVADLSARTIRSARLHGDFGGLRSFAPASKAQALGFLTNTGGAGLLDLATLELKVYRELEELPPAAAFLGSGALLSEAPRRRSLTVTDLLTNEVCAEHQLANGRAVMVVTSPRDEKAVIGTTAEGIIMFDGASLKFTTMMAQASPTGAAGFSADGAWLAVSTYPSRIEIFRTKPRKGRYPHADIRTRTSALARALAWAPNGKRIVALFKNGAGRVFTARHDGSWDMLTFSTDEERLRHLVWSANSKQFLVTTERHGRLFDAIMAKELLRWPAMQQQVAAVFDPITHRPISWRSGCRFDSLPGDGTPVSGAFAREERPAIGVAGQGASQADAQDQSPAAIEFSFKGRKLRAKMADGEHTKIAEVDREAWGEFRKISACWVEKSDGTVDVFRLVDGNWHRVRLHRSRVVHADVSRDAILLAMAFPDGTVEIFDLGTGVSLLVHQSSHGPVQGLRFSATAQSLIIIYDDRTVAHIDVGVLSRRGEDLLELFEEICVFGDSDSIGPMDEFLVLAGLDQNVAEETPAEPTEDLEERA